MTSTTTQRHGARSGSAAPPSATVTKFAAYDADGIWGAGHAEDEARAEAEGYLRDRFLDQQDPVLLRTLAGLQVAPIADDLLEDVHAFGVGFEYFAIENGVLVPADEPFGGPSAKVVRIDA